MNKGTTNILRKLKVGRSVKLPIEQARAVFVFAKRLKITIATRRNGDSVTVWRLK